MCFSAWTTALAQSGEQGPSQWTVDTFDDAIDAVPGDGECRSEAGSCSLRAAIQEANSSPGLQVIHLGAGTYSLSLGAADENEAAGGDLDILDSLTIEGAGANTTIIDGMTIDRIFDIYWDAEKQTSVTLKGISLIRGRLNGEAKSGGAIYSDAELRLEDVALRDNGAIGVNSRGGAIYNDGGRLVIERATLSGNVAGTSPRAQLDIYAAGGSIYSSGYFSMDASTVETSRAILGGGIYIADGTAFIQSSAIISNNSFRHGGGLHIGGHSADDAMLSANAIITDSRIESNSVLSQRTNEPNTRGGGVFVGGDSVAYFINDSIKANDAARQCYSCTMDGGGIANEEGIVIVHRSVFEQNGASRWGGAIYNATGQTAHVSDSTFRNNVVTSDGTVDNPLSGSMGGAIASETDIKVTHSLIVDNRAYHGSAIAGSGTFDNVTIMANSSRSDGAIFIPTENYRVNLQHVTLARNTTTATAGAANIHNPFTNSLHIRNTIIGEAGTAANCMGELVSEGNNVISDSSCLTIPQASDTIGDVLLGELADNGGASSTALVTDASPARDKVPAVDCGLTDQRYLLRSGDFCDAGAADSDAVAGQFGIIGLESAELRVDEHQGDVVINVLRSDGATGAVSVDYLVMDGTAYGAEGDYTTALRGTLSWEASDDAAKTITVEIGDDAVAEADETFSVHLLAPQNGAQLAAESALTVTIIDNDGAAPTPGDPGGGGGGGGALWGLLLLMLPRSALKISARRLSNRGRQE